MIEPSRCSPQVIGQTQEWTNGYGWLRPVPWSESATIE